MSERPPRLDADEYETWQEYWQAHGMPWRTQPEISPDRKAELAQIQKRRNPNNAPFEGVRLSRADIEWIIESFGQQTASSPDEPWIGTDPYAPAVNMRGAILTVHLAGLPLGQADLEKADLRNANLVETNLQRALLIEAQLQEANLYRANLYEANLGSANLRQADLTRANLTRASFRLAILEEATLESAELEGTVFIGANLRGANLRWAVLDARTRLDRIHVGSDPENSIRVADTHWGGTNLAVVNMRVRDGIPWSGVERLRDELRNPKNNFLDFPTAIRAYRQLATALREQGLADEANRFAYRAQVLRCKQEWSRVRAGQLRGLGSALGFTALWGLAGFGYRPAFPLFWWVGIIVAGTLAFYGIDHPIGATWPPSLPNGQWVWSALIESINASHGRGIFFTDTGAPTLVQGAIASVLAVFGLVIEAVLIATFTQRFFGR